MRLRIDRQTAAQFTYVGESAGGGDRRRIYSAPAPYRAILICRNGLELESLVGEVVDAFITEERGTLPFEREVNVGLWSTQISIFGRLPNTLPEITLGQILARGQRNKGK